MPKKKLSSGSSSSYESSNSNDDLSEEDAKTIAQKKSSKDRKKKEVVDQSAKSKHKHKHHSHKEDSDVEEPPKKKIKKNKHEEKKPSSKPLKEVKVFFYVDPKDPASDSDKLHYTNVAKEMGAVVSDRLAFTVLILKVLGQLVSDVTHIVWLSGSRVQFTKAREHGASVVKPAWLDKYYFFWRTYSYFYFVADVRLQTIKYQKKTTKWATILLLISKKNLRLLK